MEQNKNIKLDEETWRKLVDIKLNKKMKRIADVIKMLVDKQYKAQVP
jgi:predicted CopG family antitoxin